MDMEQTALPLLEYRSAFERLNTVGYRNMLFNGLRIRLLEVHYMDCLPDWNVKRHKHSFFELHYVSAFETFTTIGNREYKVERGNFYVMPPGTFHAHRQAPGTSHEGFALRWEIHRAGTAADDAGSTFYETENSIKVLNHAHSEPVKDDGTVMTAILDILHTAQVGGSVPLLQLGVLQLLFSISAFFKSGVVLPGYEADGKLSENHSVYSAIKFMEDNYAEEIDIEDISNAVHLSYSHLSRLFKKLTGETINYRLNNIRMKRAQHLLKCSDKSISSIAAEVGFGSEHYFCTVFKKFFGMTPGTFRGTGSGLME